MTADDPGIPFILTGDGPGGAGDITVVNTTPNSGLFDDLDAAFAIQPFWAVIPLPDESEALMIEAGRWSFAGESVGSTRRNVAILQTADSDIPDGVSPNFAETLIALGYTTAFPVVHANTSDKMSHAGFGRFGGQDPGSRAWHGGRLSGTTLTEEIIYTDAEGENMREDRVSWVEREAPTVTADIIWFWGQGSGGRFIVQKQAEHYWWLRTGFAVQDVFKSLSGANLDEAGTQKFVSAINAINQELGTSDPPVIDLARTTVTPVSLDDVPLAEQELGDYKTNGGITVATVLLPKLRDLAVSATFALA